MAKAKLEKQRAARRLRKQGMSIKDISAKIGCAVGSVSLWCRDIALTAAQKESLRQKRIAAQVKGAAVHAANAKRRRDAARADGQKLVERLADRDLLLFGLGLYLGDGSKTQRSTVEVTNMDVEIHRLVIQWFGLLGVAPEQLRAKVHYTGSGTDRSVINWWCRQLGLNPSQFTSVDRNRPVSSKQRTRRKAYKGTLHIRVHDTALKSKVMGMIGEALRVGAQMTTTMTF